MSCAARWRHVPVEASSTAPASARPVGHRADMGARRRLGERDRVQHGQQVRQRPLGHLAVDLYVNDLRPPRLHSLRAIQGRLQAGTLRATLRPRGHPVRIPLRPSLVAGLAASLRSLLRSRSDCWRGRLASFAPIRSLDEGVPGRCCPSQPTLQLSQPQLQPLPQLPLRVGWPAAARSPSFASTTARSPAFAARSPMRNRARTHRARATGSHTRGQQANRQKCRLCRGPGLKLGNRRNRHQAETP